MKIDICPKCGEPLIQSFCLPYKELVCVPCGIGFPMWNDCTKREIEKKEYDALYEKYKDDVDKKGNETVRKYGGRCTICDDKFDCERCKKTLERNYKYWGKKK